jgi:Predicted transcriptional regulators
LDPKILIRPVDSDLGAYFTELARLQQIMFYRELGFSLRDIKHALEPWRTIFIAACWRACTSA